MKKILFIILILSALCFPVPSPAMTLTGGVSATENVPTGFFGSWQVSAVRSDTTNTDMFAPYSVEIWNLSKTGDVITLTNPVSGAQASITVKNATTDTFTFQRVTGDKNEKVTETAKLTLSGDNFYGLDTMSVKTFKNGMLAKEERCSYKLKAKKLSGADIGRIFGVRY